MSVLIDPSPLVYDVKIDDESCLSSAFVSTSDREGLPQKRTVAYLSGIR